MGQYLHIDWIMKSDTEESNLDLRNEMEITMINQLR